MKTNSWLVHPCGAAWTVRGRRDDGQGQCAEARVSVCSQCPGFTVSGSVTQFCLPIVPLTAVYLGRLNLSELQVSNLQKSEDNT